LSYSTSHKSKETSGNAINHPQSPIPKAYKLLLQHLRDWMDPTICNGIPGPFLRSEVEIIFVFYLWQNSSHFVVYVYAV